MTEEPEGKYWEKTRPDGTVLSGYSTYGSHTHVGPDFVSIRDEKTNQQIRWNTGHRQNQDDF